MMDHYLAGIAARNNAGDNFSFISPVETPLPNSNGMAESESFKEVIQPIETIVPAEITKTEGRKSHEDGGGDSLHSQAIKRLTPDETGALPPRETEKVHYFSRHLERIHYHENLIDASPDFQKKENQTGEKEKEKQISSHPEKTPLGDKVENFSFGKEKRISNEILFPGTEPPKELPDDGNDVFTANETSRSSVLPSHPFSGKAPQADRGIREILPRQPDIPSQNKSNSTDILKREPGMKLVIGKITVEIISPPVSRQQKIITRVVQKGPEENHPKNNRLRFGLGQL